MGRIRERKIKRDRLELQQRRFAAVCQQYHTWCVKNADSHVLPRAVDFVRHEEIRSFVTSPNETEIDKRALASIATQFSVWVDEWQTHCRQSLITQFRRSKSFNRVVEQLDETVDPLHLAITTINCQDCLRPTLMRFPECIVHSCHWRPYWSNWSDGEEEDEDEDEDENDPCDPVQRLAQGVMHCQGWSAQSVSLDKMLDRAIAIVKACGQDPLTATAETMDVVDVRLWCGICEDWPGEKGRKVMNWRAAVSVSTRNGIL